MVITSIFKFEHRGEVVLCKFANTCEESCELLKRKPNEQYHTENRGARSRKIFLVIDQFNKLGTA